MKKVIAFGTFSIIHPGHIDYLKSARKLGDHLTVIITTDKNAKKEKNRKAYFSAKERKQMILGIKYVDSVVIGDEKDFFKPIKKIKPDIIAIGYDGKCCQKGLEHTLKEKGINAKVKRMKKHKEHSSSKILKKLGI